MKKLSLIAALAIGGLIACSNLVTAQDAPKESKKGGKRGYPTVEQRMEQLTTALTLTDAQKPKVKEALEDNQKKMQELRSETDQEARRTKMQELRKEMETKMKAILTPEQFTKFTEMNQRRGGKKKAE